MTDAGTTANDRPANGAPVNITDPEHWLPLSGLEPGFDANKAKPTTELAGREFGLRIDGGGWAHYGFGSAGLAWDADGGEGVVEAEVLPVAHGLYLVEHAAGPRSAVTLLLDTALGRALRVVTTLGELGGSAPTVATQRFQVATIDGIDPLGEAPAPTTELIGRRVMYVYSADHAYEHVYLNEHFYTWQCLRGPERGQGDTDPATVYKLREETYLIGWREKIVPCAAVVALNLADLRSHGMLYGYDDAGTGTVHFTFGAHATPLGRIEYPAGYHPAEPSPADPA